jgi:hypothetical protein
MKSTYLLIKFVQKSILEMMRIEFSCEFQCCWFRIYADPDTPNITVQSSVADPDPFQRDPDPDPSIIKQKWQEKPWFLLFCDFFFNFLSSKNDTNVALKSN